MREPNRKFKSASPSPASALTASLRAKRFIDVLKDLEKREKGASYIDYTLVGDSTFLSLGIQIKLLYRMALANNPGIQKKKLRHPPTLGIFMERLLEHKVVSSEQYKVIMSTVKARNELAHEIKEAVMQGDMTEEEAIPYFNNFIFKLYPTAIETIETILK